MTGANPITHSLREELISAYDEYVADPSAATSVDEAFDEVLAELRAEQAEPRSQRPARD